MVEPNNNESILLELSRLLKGDFAYIHELRTPISEEEQVLYHIIEKYHRLFSDLYDYFETEYQKIDVLSLTHEERIESSNNITRANEYIADASKKQAVLSEECAGMAGDFRVEFDNLLKVSKNLMNECNHATDISSQGRNHITQYLDESKKTQDLLVNIAEQIAQLTANMKSIETILKLIKDISDQTNILAINAHIESVHAGAAGAGFAIIAREIKKLAAESKEASDKISDTIGLIDQEVSLISKTALSGKSLAESQSLSIISVDEAMNSTEQAIGDLIQRQSKSFDLIQDLDSANNRMIAKISEIASEAKKSSATCQVVADVSLDQSKQDEDYQSMIQSLKSFNRTNSELIHNIKMERNSKTKKRVGIICLEQSEFYREIEKTATITGEKLNIQVVSKTPLKFDVEKQLSAFNEFMDQDIDGIIIVPGDAARFKPLLINAEERGIKVVCVDADVDGSDVYITSDNFEGGRLAGKAAERALNGKGRVYVLLCASEISTVQERQKGFQDELQKFKDISISKVIEQKDTNRDVTAKLLEEIVLHSQQFDLLYLVTAESGEIAVDLWSKNRLGKKLVILSKSDKVTTAVAQEIVSAQIVQNNKAWGELALQRLSELFQGKPVPEFEDTGMYEINRNNFVIFQGQ